MDAILYILQGTQHADKLEEKNGSPVQDPLVSKIAYQFNLAS